MRDLLDNPTPCLRGSALSLGASRALWIVLTFVGLAALWAARPVPVRADTPSGYQEYFIPGGEDQLWGIFVDMDNYDPEQPDGELDEDAGMHAVISVVAGADSTTVYYDHWEDGYDFDPAIPGTADETVVLGQGETHLFESSYIPVPRTPDIAACGSYPAGSGSEPCYDGRDRIYTAGGAVTVNRASWTESSGATTLYALAWEVYPVQPWLDYTIPVGENLAAAAPGPDYNDFEKTYVIIQAAEDTTTVEIDEPGGATPDQTDVLDRGQVTGRYHVDAGTTIRADAPIQVQFIVGTAGTHGHYELRGYTAMPEAMWDEAYYVPVGSFSSGWDSDAYLYNPSATDVLTVTWVDALDGGTFTIPAGGTLSYEDGTGHLLPQRGGTYLSGSHPFWAVASVDTESNHADWGYSLVPVSHLTHDYTIGWSPSTLETNARGSFLFVTAAQADTTVFVDYEADGTIDDEYLLDLLQVQQIDDATDYDMTGAHVWASKPIAVVWGPDPEVVGGAENYLDLGYAALPFRQAWMDPVLTLDKGADPAIIAPGAGERTTFTLVVESYDYAVEGVDVVDALPADWVYVSGSTTLTFPDGSQSSGGAADPSVAGQRLTWDLSASLSAGEALTIAFEAETTATPAEYYSLNEAWATGTSGSETWSANDTALIYVSALSLDKTSSAGGSGVQAGDTITYTLVIRNAGAATQHNLVVSDAVPEGTTYVPGSSRVEGMQTVRDEFNAISFGNNDGPLSWSTDWQENEGDGPDAGLVRVREDPGVGEAYVLQVGWPKQSRRAWRSVDLSGVPSAVFSFDYRRVDIDANDTYWIGVSPDGGTTWDVLQTIEPGHDTAYHHASYDITPFTSADTAIGFQSGFKGGNSDADYVGIDNVQIRFPGVAAGGDPPELISGVKRYDLAPGETLTVTFRVAVDDPPPTGLSEIVNTASVTSDELTEHVTDTAVERLLTTAVRLASFAAHPRGDDIVVTWETAMEIDNVGFHLYRARAAAGPYVRLNEALIPTQYPGSTFGAVYPWIDGDVAPGVRYFYRLEDLDRFGVRTVHGPIQAALPHVAGGEGHTVYLPMVLRNP